MHTKIVKKVLRTQGTALALLIVAGCSANPHTLAHKPAEPEVAAQSPAPQTPAPAVADQSAPVAEEPAPVSPPAPEVVVQPTEPVVIIEPQPTVVVPPPVVVVQPTDPVVIVQPAPPAPPAPAPVAPVEPTVVAVAGRDGANGRDGLNGCSIAFHNQEYRARTLNAAERVVIAPQLPYVSNRAHQIPMVQIGQNQNSACGIGYVSNSQVVMAVDIEVPNYQAYRQLQDLNLTLSITKQVTSSERRFLSSEMLCMLNGVNKCSGEPITARNWQANRNTQFFATDPMLNQVFTQLALENQLQRSCGGRRFYQANDALFSLMEGFQGVDLVQTIYADTTESQDPFVRKTLYFVVADDTYVSEATMNVRMTYDGCKVIELQKASETAGSQSGN